MNAKTLEEIQRGLSSFGSLGPGSIKSLVVTPGFDSDDANLFCRCISEFLQEVMHDTVHSAEDLDEQTGRLTPAKAWVCALLVEMMDAINYVDHISRPQNKPEGARL